MWETKTGGVIEAADEKNPGHKYSPSSADLELVSSAQASLAHPPREQTEEGEMGNETVVGVSSRGEAVIEYEHRHLALVSNYLGVLVVVEGKREHIASGYAG